MQLEDLWVEKLAKAASGDIKYNLMVQHLETKTEFTNIPNECELSDMGLIMSGCQCALLRMGNT